ncbi:hypothetical protein PWG15_09470 [Ensifer adhaerens]|uniref:hypothetical protein n=1 Tax=Ensifer adhaerens TaxID=106592 RepID=UPI0023A9EA40|nr:hypothetical protein [Ensifer adhaerens]WDZ78695.1 hypothetical protein PWG15_09470 [Ensifer adhaerens]
MRIIIAATASLALASAAFAAISPVPAEKQPVAKTVGTLELADGGKKHTNPTSGKTNQNRQTGKRSYYD